jgi:hypothetical protein
MRIRVDDGEPPHLVALHHVHYAPRAEVWKGETRDGREGGFYIQRQ